MARAMFMAVAVKQAERKSKSGSSPLYKEESQKQLKTA